jgi:hypothetical protein
MGYCIETLIARQDIEKIFSILSKKPEGEFIPIPNLNKMGILMTSSNAECNQINLWYLDGGNVLLIFGGDSIELSPKEDYAKKSESFFSKYFHLCPESKKPYGSREPTLAESMGADYHLGLEECPPIFRNDEEREMFHRFVNPWLD